MKQDTYRHKGLRKKLIEQLISKGISDQVLLDAMMQVPRHFFFDTSFIEHAYEDKAFSIGYGQTISQPYTVAFQTQLLEVKKGYKVLEIGTGSGYQACILAKMGAFVYTIERIYELYKRTKKFLEELNFHKIKVFYGDGFKGLPAFAPYDRIITTAAAPYIPQTLKEQLKINGILVIPVNITNDLQVMKRLIKVNDNEFIEENHGNFRFVPMIEDIS